MHNANHVCIIITLYFFETIVQTTIRRFLERTANIVAIMTIHCTETIKFQTVNHGLLCWIKVIHIFIHNKSYTASILLAWTIFHFHWLLLVGILLLLLNFVYFPFYLEMFKMFRIVFVFDFMQLNIGVKILYCHNLFEGMRLTLLLLCEFLRFAHNSGKLLS